MDFPPPPPLSLSLSLCLCLSWSHLSPGYVEGTFRLVWQRRQDSGSSVEVSLEDSSATLYETGMPVEPTKTYLVIREKFDGTVVQRVAEQVRP